MTYTNEEVIQNIKDCGQSIIDNAELIASKYEYLLNGITITCHVNEADDPPYIEVKTQFIPERFIERMK